MAAPKQSNVGRTPNRKIKPVSKGPQRPFPSKTTRASSSKKRK